MKKMMMSPLINKDAHYLNFKLISVVASLRSYYSSFVKYKILYKYYIPSVSDRTQLSQGSKVQ